MPRRLKHRLADETRRLLEGVALVDVSRADDRELRELAEHVAELADRLAAVPHFERGMANVPGDDALLSERSGMSGFGNPLAPPIAFEMDGEITRGWATYGWAYEGPPGCLHGGFVAAAFDDLLGLAQIASGEADYTGTLTVRMRKPTPLHRRIDYEAWVEKVAGRKIVCKGTSRDGDELLAEAEILFIQPKGGIPIDRLDRLDALEKARQGHAS
jgi:hypothetical protein